MQTMLPAVLSFDGTDLTIVHHNGEPWLAAGDIARALGFARADAISRIYQRNASEFTDAESSTVNLTVPGRNLVAPIRIFSPRGCWLVAMLARTDRAAAFRRWVLDVLEHVQSPAVAQHATVFAQLAQRRSAYASWAWDARDALKRAGVEPPAWPFAHDEDVSALATAVAGDLLCRHQWLVSFDHQFRPLVHPMPFGAYVVRDEELPSVIAETVTSTTILPAIIEAAAKRLGEEQRRAPMPLPRPAPTPQSVRADRWLATRTQCTAAELIEAVLGGNGTDRALQLIAGRLLQTNGWRPARMGNDRRRIWRRPA